MDANQFVRKMAEHLAQDLTANQTIREFTCNTALIGGYAEATVRQLIKRMVSPLRVSHGSIIHETICPDNVPEIDTIVWTPCPMPAVFEAGEFALVPRHSAVAFLEIKRTNYAGVGKKLNEAMSREKELVPSLGGALDPDGALGVICLYQEGGSDPSLRELMGKKRVVALLEREEDGTLRARPKEMLILVNFLQGVRLRARLLNGNPRVLECDD